MSRWLVAYWCLYHCGAASYISEHEGSEFWDMMDLAARNEVPTPLDTRWPRGSERRHFRGAAAIRAVEGMRARYPSDPERMVSDFAHRDPAPCPEIGTDYALSFEEVSRRARGIPLFGPWISFKVADMLDRLGMAPVNFDKAAVFMFTDPVKAALMLWRRRMGLPESATPKNNQVRDQVIDEVVSHLTHHFREFSAPPRNERPVGLQEIETILCKWKSHMNGHYPLGNDITEISEGLRPWSSISETATRMREAMPQLHSRGETR